MNIPLLGLLLYAQSVCLSPYVYQQQQQYCSGCVEPWDMLFAVCCPKTQLTHYFPEMTMAVQWYQNSQLLSYYTKNIKYIYIYLYTRYWYFIQELLHEKITLVHFTIVCFSLWTYIVYCSIHSEDMCIWKFGNVCYQHRLIHTWCSFLCCFKLLLLVYILLQYSQTNGVDMLPLQLHLCCS